jgi:hypothetical protein
MEVIYSRAEGVGKPYIGHEDLDLTKLLHLRCFWQRHLLNPSEFTYHDSFSELPQLLRPRMRKTDSANVMNLSRSWLGYYCEYKKSEIKSTTPADCNTHLACMHPVPHIRDCDRQTCADLEGHCSTIDIMVSTSQGLRYAGAKLT